MFEVKIIKRSSFEIRDFRGVKFPQSLKGEHDLSVRLSELGASHADIISLLSSLRTKKTSTIFVSPAKWRRVELAAQGEDK